MAIIWTLVSDEWTCSVFDRLVSNKAQITSEVRVVLQSLRHTTHRSWKLNLSVHCLHHKRADFFGILHQLQAWMWPFLWPFNAAAAAADEDEDFLQPPQMQISHITENVPSSITSHLTCNKARGSWGKEEGWVDRVHIWRHFGLEAQEGLFFRHKEKDVHIGSFTVF